MVSQASHILHTLQSQQRLLPAIEAVIKSKLSSGLQRTAALLCVLLYLMGSLAYAQPVMSDRTSRHLSGLNNDGFAKVIELGDFDSDGMEDLMVARDGNTPVLLMNRNGVLTNQTTLMADVGVAASNAIYVEAFDANNDGWTDLIFSRLGNSPALYLNAGLDGATQAWNGFSAPIAVPQTTNNLAIEAGDINGDGFMDLFAIQVEMDTNDLLINDGTGSFTREDASLGGLADFQRGHAVRIADVDSDGDQDIIYLESDLILYIYYNDGTGTFSNALRSAFRNPDDFAYIFGAADFNGDGIFDYRQYSNPAPNAEMSTGTFDQNGIPEYTIRTDANMLRGNRKHGTVHMRDIDGDGDMDYVLSSILRNFGSLRNTREGMRTEMVLNTGINSGVFETFVGTAWGREESYDMKILDINGDGNMDMFVGHDLRYGVYINDAPPLAFSLEPNVVSVPAVAGTDATLSVTLDSTASVSYRWELGDGTIITNNQPTLTHNYAQPGRYQVTVTAFNQANSDQISFYQRIHEPLANGIAQSSMDVLFQASADGDRLYVANPDNDSVTVVDAESNAVIGEIPVGENPRSLSLASTDSLWVVNKDSATVSIIDTQSQGVVESISLPAGSQPHGMVVDTDTGFAYVVTQATGFVLKIDVETREIVTQQQLGAALRDIALSQDGLLYVPHFISSFADAEDTRTPAESPGIVSVLSTSGLSVVNSMTMPYNRPPNNVDAGDNARGIPNYLRSPALSPAGTIAMIPAKSDNIYRGSMRDGQAREHDMLVRGILAKFDLGTETEVLNDRVQFDNNSHPTAVAFGPTGNLLFVVHESSRAYEVIDVYRNEILFSGTVGFAPTGIVVSPDGGRVYVHNWLDRSLSVIDSEGLINGTSNNADVIATIELVGNEILSPRVLAGKRLFFDSSDLRLSAQKYMSCSACHDEAGHDGRTWDFSDAGEGLRNTIDLRGRAGIGHGNVHWSSNFDEIHDFENDIREIFDGTGLLTDDDYSATISTLNPETPKAGLSAALDSLAAFTSTLRNVGVSPYRNNDGSLTDLAIVGKTLFLQSGCADCHLGDHFTDSPSGVAHNIGTVDGDTGGRLGLPLLNGGLDTPTLKGLWLTAPYLHDGSASTLQDAVLAHTELADFDVATLSTNDLDRVAQYLLQIDDSEPAPVVEPETVDPTPTDDPSNPLTIFVDGQTDDWPADTLMGRDADDISGANNTLDYSLVWMAHDNRDWYIRYDTQVDNAVTLTWGYSIHIDTDGAEFGFRGFNNELPTGTDYLLEGQILYRYTGTGQDWSWDVIGPVRLAQSGHVTELAISRQSIGNPTNVQTFFFANNVAVEGDARDYFPDSVTDPDAPIGERTIGYTLSGDVQTTPTNPIDSISNPVATLTIDGSAADWSGLTSFGLDPDDIRSNAEHIDWREAWAAHNDDQLFFTYTNDGPVQPSWGQSIMLDTDLNDTTGFRGFYNELPIGVDYLLEDNSIYRYAGTGNNWSWIASGNSTNARNGEVFELSVPRAAIGNPSEVHLVFVGNNEAIGGAGVDLYPDKLATNSADISERYFRYEMPSTTTPTELVVNIDGNLDEWPISAQLGEEDPKESADASDIDWKKMMVLQNASTIYIAYELHNAVELSWGQAVYIDRDNDINTGFRGFDNALPLGADIILEGDTLSTYSGETQTEWSWEINDQVETATRGVSTEVAIPIAMLGNSPTITMIFRGDSSALGGAALDVMPDTGTVSYSLSFNDEPLLASAISTAESEVIQNDDAGNSSGPQSMQASGGAFHAMWLLVVAIVASMRSSKRTMRLGWPVLLLALSACDSGTRISSLSLMGTANTVDTTDSADSATLESPYPAASSALALQSALPDTPIATDPLNDVSFVKVFNETLTGTQVVPPVETRESGTLNFTLNVSSGKLTGTLGHSLENVTAVTLHEAPVGDTGDVVGRLVIADGVGSLYKIPDDTYLSASQIESLNNGLMYVLVRQADYPNGILRAQISAEDVDVIPAANLADLQLKIFKPVCSGCHLGLGNTLPGIMDFTSKEATYMSLVNTVSLQNPELLRVEPGNPDNSYLVRKIEGTQSVGSRMPFRGTSLTDEQIMAVRDWISAGANP